MKPNHFILKNLLLLILIGAGSIGHPTFGREKVSFQFRKDHTFKITQFTDIHWDNKSANCAISAETINHVLKTEKPDVAILTGDIVVADPAREGWLAIAKIFEQARMPWAVVLGNHDAEPGISRDQIFELLAPLPYFVGSKGPEMYGCGNYALPVLGSDGKNIVAVLYCMDSNDYPKDRRISYYDWIRYDQIGWYRTTSDQYTAGNNGFQLPSLMFFHIPVPEYNDIVGQETTIGLKDEGVASAGINSGIFASIVEKKDVMGVFVGHDHDNNYIGIDCDIALAFGQVTGADAYGKFERGSRIIELHEGEFSFDTWIRTKSGVQFPYNYPSGLTKDDTGLEYLPGVPKKGLKQGLRYKYYEGNFKSTDELKSATAKKSGFIRNISLDLAEVPDSFAFEFSGWLKIPKKAVYRIYTYSDDGSRLFIDGREVVNNDGSHSVKRAEGQLALDEGFHEFRILYFEDYMENELEVGLSSIGIRECKIPDEFLYTE